MIGDLDVIGANKVVKEIVQHGGYVPSQFLYFCVAHASSRKAVCQKCNVTMWDEQVALFELAMSTYGSVDIVVRSFPLPG